jgi:hypothetical protein
MLSLANNIYIKHMHSIMDVATVARSCFKNNAHEMMVHMLMSCSYDAQMQGKHLGCYSPPPYKNLALIFGKHTI